MSKIGSGYWTILLFIAITFISFVLWICGLLVVWFILRAMSILTDFWAMCGALSTAVAAATVVSAGFVAYRELNEAATSRHLGVVDRLFTELNSPENIAARRWVYQNLPNNPEEGVKSITPEGRSAIKQTLNSLDHVAFLTQARWIPDDIILPWMHPMIAKTWEKLEPYVNYERHRRNEPYYYQNIGDLAKRCHAWRVKNLHEEQVRWLHDAL
jgi:hypothetical protein